jgi:hypothetical protein
VIYTGPRGGRSLCRIFRLVLSTYFYYREGEDSQVTVGEFCSDEREGRGLAIGGSMNFFRFVAFKLGPQDTKSFWQNSHGCHVLAKNSHGSHVLAKSSHGMHLLASTWQSTMCAAWQVPCGTTMCTLYQVSADLGQG